MWGEIFSALIGGVIGLIIGVILVSAIGKGMK